MMAMLACENRVAPRRGVASARIDRDEHLLESLRRREPTAADRLVATYGDRAYRLAIGITRNASDAEEALQDAFWSVIRRIDTFRGESALASWTYRIVVNAAYQRLRGRARRRNEISWDEVSPAFHEDGQHADPIMDWSASIDDPALQVELRDVLGAAIEALPADYRAVIVLHDIEGVSMAEVARSLRITEANAKSRTHRARLFLRKHLATYMPELIEHARRTDWRPAAGGENSRCGASPRVGCPSQGQPTAHVEGRWP